MPGLRPPSKTCFFLLLATLGSNVFSASAAAASAWVTTVQGYDGIWRTFGRITVKVTSRPDGEVANEFHILLEDADPDCAKPKELLPKNACTFAVHHGTDCEEIGQKLWHSTLEKDPWNAARYTSSPDGVVRGEIVIATGLDQLAMYNHVIVINDAKGASVACGSVTSTCKRHLGFCFFEWLRLATGIATVIAVINSLWLMRKHLLYNSNPILCRYTSRILLMVPIYSIQAFVSLWLQVSPTTAEWLRFCREFYEAIVIFSFLQFVLICVGGSLHIIERFDGRATAFAFSVAASNGPGAAAAAAAALEMEEEREGGEEDCPSNVLGNSSHIDGVTLIGNGVPIFSNTASSDGDDAMSIGTSSEHPELGHICPWKWLFPRWRSARQMLQVCTRGTLTYVFVGMAVPVVTLVCRTFLRHHELEVAMQVGKIMIMISSMIAINSLFELAHIFLPELKDLSPVSKFVSVKMVVFFTFWQGIVLGVLQRAGLLSTLIDVGHAWTSDSQIAQALQNAAICIEMCVASIAHHWAFPPTDYRIVRKKLKAARTNSLLGVGLDEQMRRGFQVVDFRDIFSIAWNGFAPERFTTAAAEDVSCGTSASQVGETSTDSDSSEDVSCGTSASQVGETSTDSDSSEEGSDTSSCTDASEELERGPPTSNSVIFFGSPISTIRRRLESPTSHKDAEEEEEPRKTDTSTYQKAPENAGKNGKTLEKAENAARTSALE